MARYRAGVKWWLEDAEVIEEAIKEQSARYIADVWQEKVAVYAKEEADRAGNEFPDGRGSVSISEILLRLGVETPRQEQAAANRVARCLRFAGWKRTNVGPRGAREWRYRKVFQS